MWVPVVGNDVATAVEAVTGVGVNDKLSQLSDEDDKLPSEPVTTIVFAELSNGCGGLELLLLQLQLLLVLLVTLAVTPPSTPLPRTAVAVPDEDASLAAILVDDVAAAPAAAVGDGVAGTRAKFSGFICMEPKLIRCRLPVVCIRTRMGGWRQPRANRALRIIPKAPPTFCPA